MDGKRSNTPIGEVITAYKVISREMAPQPAQGGGQKADPLAAAALTLAAVLRVGIERLISAQKGDESADKRWFIF